MTTPVTPPATPPPPPLPTASKVPSTTTPSTTTASIPNLSNLSISSSSSTLPTIPNTDPTRCILDTYRTAISHLLSKSLNISSELIYPAVQYGKKGVDFTVALPRFKLSGSVGSNAALVIDYFNNLPKEEEVIRKYVESVESDKAFLHFMCNTEGLLKDVLGQVDELKGGTGTNNDNDNDEMKEGGVGGYGCNRSGEGKKVVIEYSSPNIAKSFHVGHLRSTIIGAFLRNLYKACGWEVVGLNYLGDWGTQFGLIAVGFEKYGSKEKLEQDAIKHLFEIYVQINKDAETNPQVKSEAAAWFRRMENYEPEALQNWKIWRELSVKKYEKEYERLNVFFEVYTGESEVGQGTIDKALIKLDEMGLIEDSEGAKLVNLEKWKLGKAVVRKRDGTSIYLTRDIGGAIERYEKYKFDKMIYVVSSQQDLHLSQFFKVLQLMGFEWAKDLIHINYGLVQGMSTRKGTVVFLEQIIHEATQTMHEQMMKNEEKYKAVEEPVETSREIGITGIKIQDMAAKRINNYTFNWDRMLSFEGDTGPYLQYAHVRLASIGRKNPHLLPLGPASSINTSLLKEYAHAREITFLLGTYPDVVMTALKTHEPSGVVTFAFRLAHGISSAWDHVVVLGEKDLEKAKAKLFMFEMARVVLGQAMKLLSIRPLERM